LLLTVVVLVAFLIARRPRPSLQLNRYTSVELDTITFGTYHTLEEGTIVQKMLRHAPRSVRNKLPERLFNGLKTHTLYSASNSVVVWLRGSGLPAELIIGITDTNGIGGPQNNFSVPTGIQGLHPLLFDQWPRTAPEIAISFFEERGNETRSLGRLTFKNPSPQSIPSFQPSPPIITNGAVELSLNSLEVLANGKTFRSSVDHRNACRARFLVSEMGRKNQDWTIDSLFLADSGGNRHQAAGPAQWNGDFFEIFSDPLWLDNPVWQLEATVVRSSNFPVEEMVTFPALPTPSSQKEDIAFQTNLLGHTITVRSMKEAKFELEKMGTPGFALEVHSPTEQWVPMFARMWDAQGEPIKVPPQHYGPGYCLIRFPSKKEDPGPLRVMVTLQKRQKFVFYAKPTLITAPSIE
jgi:hypothetical protein